MYGLHYELETKMTEEVADRFIKMVKEFRAVYGKDKFTRVNLDSAGEWSDENEEFHKKVNSELDPRVKFILMAVRHGWQWHGYDALLHVRSIRPIIGHVWIY